MMNIMIRISSRYSGNSPTEIWLAMSPKILCYDEPTSALDPEMRKEVAKIILGLKKDGMTQLVVTHDFDFADEIADDILKVKALDKSFDQVQDVDKEKE